MKFNRKIFLNRKNLKVEALVHDVITEKDLIENKNLNFLLQPNLSSQHSQVYSTQVTTSIESNLELLN